MTVPIKRKDYKVTFDPQGGTVTPSSHMVTYKKSYTSIYGEFPVPVRPDHVFKGWNTKADGSGETITDITVTKDITVYAKWTPTFIIRYDANGGSGTMQDTVVEKGVSTPTTKCRFYAPGTDQAFQYWYAHRQSDDKWYYTDSGGSTGWYKEGSQPAGYTKYQYKNGVSVANTSSVAGNVVIKVYFKNFWTVFVLKSVSHSNVRNS